MSLKRYHRPTDIDEAVRLYFRPDISTLLLAGGTAAVVALNDDVGEIVDLQATGLEYVRHNSERLTLGAMTRLQTVVDDDRIPDLLRDAARLAGSNAIRNQATVGGSVAEADWESELLAALLVFEAEVTLKTAVDTFTVSLEHFLEHGVDLLERGIITEVELATTGRTAMERVGRTPADRPIVAVVGRLHQGRLRLTACGVAPVPLLLRGDVRVTVGDFRGSAEYRQQMLRLLTDRVVSQLGGGEL